MPRFFNTTGPCEPRRNYMLPATARLPAMRPFIDEELYFVLHAPRQTGKTTAMRGWAAELRAQGLAACWVTLERAQGVDEVERAEPLWVEALIDAAEALPAPLRPPAPEPSLARPPGSRLRHFLRAWAGALDVPLVLLLDEADVIGGQALVSFLRQLRDGFMDRGVGSFPTSVALISRLSPQVAYPDEDLGFVAATATLRDLTAAEVGAVVAQHSAATGQEFMPEAVAALCRLTEGHAYLINALADLCVSALATDRTRPVRADHIAEAVTRLLQARTVHLDGLIRRLRAPRFASLVEALVVGEAEVPFDDQDVDLRVILDLGLLRAGPNGLQLSNPIYAEALGQHLSLNVEASLGPPSWPWRSPEGRLDMPALLAAFRAWWRESADVVAGQIPNYPEAVPHLALCGFLQRVVNGGGRVHREFAAGRGAMDLLVEYGPDRFAIELKRVRSRDALEAVVERGVAQLARYLDTVGLNDGWLIVFDVRPDRSWEERLWTRTVDTPDGKRVVVLGA